MLRVFKKGIQNCVFLVAFCMVLLCACSNTGEHAQAEPAADVPTPQEVQTEPVPDDPEPQEEADADLSRFREVLTGETDFMDAWTKEAVNLADLSQVVTSDPSVAVEVETFTVTDLDEDGMPEVTLQLGPNDTYGFVILHEKEEDVYGYWIPYRAFSGLKEDGTFTFSSGAGDTGIGTLTFGDQTCETEALSRSETAYDTDNNAVALFFVNGQEATQEAFEAELEHQNQKPDAAWYEFTDANVDTNLT